MVSDRAWSVYSARLSKDKSGVSRGYAFVTMTTADAADKALNAMNDRSVEGKQIKVQYSANVTRRKCKRILARVFALCVSAGVSILASTHAVLFVEYASSIYRSGPGIRLITTRRNLHVTGLPADFTDVELKDMFTKYGAVESVRMLKPDRYGKNEGVGLVKYVA